jgi:hypothetical protein
MRHLPVDFQLSSPTVDVVIDVDFDTVVGVVFSVTFIAGFVQVLSLSLSFSK